MKLCTHCGKPLNSGFNISLYLMVERKIDKNWEKINNSEIINSEFICNDCFKAFSDTINNFNKRK
ncbi:MAG: hypothetical protein ACOCP4_02215 [Candidatus Woesearchaeota archaeon]